MNNNKSNLLLFIKSDVFNIHWTNLIHRIDDSINSLNVNVSDTLGGQNHVVKVFIKYKKLYFLVPLSIRPVNAQTNLHIHTFSPKIGLSHIVCIKRIVFIYITCEGKRI